MRQEIRSEADSKIVAAATEAKNDQKNIQEFLNAISCRVGTSQLNNALLEIIRNNEKEIHS